MRLKLALTLILILLTSYALTSLKAYDGRVRVIVRFKDRVHEEVLEGYGATILHKFKTIPAALCLIPANILEELRGNSLIDYVEVDGEVKLEEDVVPWGVKAVGAIEAQRELQSIASQASTLNSGVVVAVIDTGIDYHHPDLAGNVIGGCSFVDYTSDYMDDNGHGTHVAGIIAALDNEVGVVGVDPRVKLYALKALDSHGRGYLSSVVMAIEWAVEHGADIVCMSLGSNRNYKALEEVCREAYGRGVLLVAAAGNSGAGYPWTASTVKYPAKYDAVIAVGAVDVNGRRASWSSIGPELELVAPGVDILSTYLNGTYAYGSGTSMACPHVVGVAALVMEADVEVVAPSYDLDHDGEWDPAEVRAWLRDTAIDLGPPGKDSYYGYGMVSASRALQGLSEGGGRALKVANVEVKVYRLSFMDRYIAKAEVLIVDEEGRPVEGALVRGCWGGAVKGEVEGLTGRDGVARFTTIFTYRGEGVEVTFKVLEVSLKGYSYDVESSVDSGAARIQTYTPYSVDSLLKLRERLTSMVKG